MRDQYAGDLSDLIKFSLLRAFGSGGRRLAVAWYYAPGHDGRNDGRHVEHRAEKSWQALDPTVHHALARLRERTVAALERLPIWPAGTRFHRDPVPRRGRDKWVHGMCLSLADTDLVFLDPDNGLGRHWQKHARIDDLAELRQNNRALVFIKFPHRMSSYEAQIQSLHALLRSTGFRSPLTVRTSVSVLGAESQRRVPRARFFTVVGADAHLAQIAEAFAARVSAIPFASASVIAET
ncbi:MAG: hypothetical protein IPI67_12800 [Myxococcales bacterium]|nr:hypothetical protein [Myxococcales bacterium]